MIKRQSFIYEAYRGGVPYRRLLAQDGGQITCDSSAEIKRSITCNLIVPDDVDFLRDELNVSMNIDGVITQLGRFIVTTQPKTIGENGQISHNIEAYDRTYKVSRKRLETRNEGFIGQGQNYIDVVSAFLIRCGIENMILEPTSKTISSDREEWDVGTSYLTIINTLLKEINYNTLWFDEEGNARSEEYVSPIDKDPRFEYKSGRDSVILRQHKRDDDTFDSYNVFIVGVSNSDTSIYVSAVNDDPSSRLSTVNRGRIVAPVVLLDDVTDQQTLQDYADNLKLKSMISTETLQIETEIQPRHNIYDVVSVQLPEVSGKYEEIRWEIKLSPGATMSHTLRRAIYV